MSRRDHERYVRKHTGVVTPGERDRQIDNLSRYRAEPEEAGSPFARPPQFPPGFTADSGMTTTAVSGRTQARYLGQAPDDIALITVRMNVTTPVSAAGFVWAELGIGTSEDVPFGGGAAISLNGYTDVGSTFTTTGVKETEILVNIAKYVHCWLVWGSEATTPFSVTGGLADVLGTGITQIANATRPSTMADPQSFTVSSSASSMPWVSYLW